jgi:hypothetical protein
MIQEMSARAKPVIFKPRHRIVDDHLSPSSIELWDLMYMETCVTAEAAWSADWTFCPVCMCQVDDFGERRHKSRKAIEV